MTGKTRIEKSLMLLRDLNTLRRRRDWKQAGFVDGLLEDHDMESGWCRSISIEHDAIVSGKNQK